MINRRQLLTVGAASMVVAGAGLGVYGATRTPTKALAPWGVDAHDYADARLRALSYAILSPNPHNRQPWIATLAGTNEIVLTCDLDRRLPETDPFDRQITIGLGCFLELLSIAAAEESLRADITHFPDGDPATRLDERAVAHIRLVEDSTLKRDPLFATIKYRRSNKEPYDTARPLAKAVFDQLLAGARQTVEVTGTFEEKRVADLRDLSWRAHKIESFTPRTMQESIDLMRIGKAEIEQNPDGIDLGGFPMDLFAKLGFVNRVQMADPQSTAFKQGLDMYHELLHSAMGHVWVVTADNSRTAQLEAGREWVRLNLRANASGVAIHPLSQALQEYVEMTPLYAEIHDKLAIEAPKRLQMFARIGYGPAVPPSPRWPIESRLHGTA